MCTVRRIKNFSMLLRTFLKSIGYLALLGVLTVFIIPDTSFARVFAAFGLENFIRSSNKPATEVREFRVKDPDASEFTMHIFYAGIKKDFQGVVPSALVKLNGAKIVTPNEFSRNAYYIRKPVTLLEENTLSLELRGKPGSGIRIVITGKNDEPQAVYFGNHILPDGRNLFGPELRYFWAVIDEPEGGNAVLSDPYSSDPFLTVSTPGEYSIELRIETDSFETDPFIVKLTAGEYPDFVPKPVETRVGGIKVGPNTYGPPAHMTCATIVNQGFQVLVLDRGSLEKIDNRTFNIPCGNQEMIDFLSSLGDTSKYPTAPLVIVSTLGTTPPPAVCDNSSDCPLGRALEGLGGTSIFRSNYYRKLDYAIEIPEINGYMGITFHYSLIGIPGLEQNQGNELNNWDHMVVTADSENIINANIQGYFVQDINKKWTFTYPEFVQIETRTRVENGNIIKVGGDSYYSPGIPGEAVGGFQALVLDRDTLKPASSLAETNKSFWTNYGPGYETESGVEQQKMYDYLNSVRQSTPFQRFVVIIASIGNIGPPINYKATVFADLINLIADYYGGTTGILVNLGPAAPSIVTYSLVGMNNVGNVKYGLGVINTVEESAPNQNLKIVMHKDKQGWYEPATTYTGPADTASPDFNLLSVALQVPTPWPLYDQTSEPQEGEYWAAYRYISGQLGEDTDNIRSKYVMRPIDPGGWYTTCLYLPYPPNSDFSEEVFEAMRTQLCDEFNFVSHINPFMDDMRELLQDMQIAEGNSLDTVYKMVKSTVYVDEDAQAKYDAMIVLRGMLMIASAIDPDPVSSAAMGAINGVLWLGMHLSKEQGGTDYTSIDSAVSDLKDQMNNLWNNCQMGSDIVLDMVKSDWGKLRYVGHKLMTSQESGGWQYYDTDKADWKTTLTNSLESYYFQSLLPAADWKIDYLKNTNIPAPWNFGYTVGSAGTCLPYCDGSTYNQTAFWIDKNHYPPITYDWYVLENKIYRNIMTDCRFVGDGFDRSASLREILFGNGDWEDSSGNPIGVKLNLSRPIFYERWLPSFVYIPSTTLIPDWSWSYYGVCNDIYKD